MQSATVSVAVQISPPLGAERVLHGWSAHWGSPPLQMALPQPEIILSVQSEL